MLLIQAIRTRKLGPKSFVMYFNRSVPESVMVEKGDSKEHSFYFYEEIKDLPILFYPLWLFQIAQNRHQLTQLAFICSKLKIETLDQGVKYFQV